jgi:glycogen operon protein
VKEPSDLPKKVHKTYPGYPFPLGVHLHDDGALFSLFSRNATSLSLLLFSDPKDHYPYQSINFDPTYNRTGDIWHVWVDGVMAGQAYAYIIDGPYNPKEGHRFNKNRLIVDPYTTVLSKHPSWDFLKSKGYMVSSPLGDLSFSHRKNFNSVPRSIVTGNRFDWQNDIHPRVSWADTIIYETHVRGLTIHPSSGVDHPGTYSGVIEKIPYFRDMGITALEFLPIQEFNEAEIAGCNPLTKEPLVNYWGYSTVAFFSPKGSYSHSEVEGGQIIEFKEMVMELHKAGIEVILDIVFNHTAEGNEKGPTISFRGIDNSIYYVLEKDKRFYQNFTGCGNTVNCNHPIVRQLIIDCLVYWVVKMHVDGFRFDLASVMGRDENGDIMRNPPLLTEIAENPILRDTKLIAEAWDAAGAYQVGSFPGHRWSEWNGKYRDDIRLFWRGDPGMIGLFASRISGSADIYQKSGKEPLNSINFITCHDGFTLNDLVSYNEKHNDANDENNADGTNENYSYNYGVEGPTSNQNIEKLRIRQIKNLMATLFISRGVPLFLGGDEFRRSQKGNNNAFCQDNEISWYNWGLLQTNKEIFRFIKEIIAFRKRHSVLKEVKFYTEKDITWYAADGTSPDWAHDSRSLSCMIHGKQELFLMFHAGFEKIVFTIPSLPSGLQWFRTVDTSASEPEDICPANSEKPLKNQTTYLLEARSMVILVSKSRL